MTARLQRDDEVMALAGKDKGRRGKAPRVSLLAPEALR